MLLVLSTLAEKCNVHTEQGEQLLGSNESKAWGPYLQFPAGSRLSFKITVQLPELAQSRLLLLAGRELNRPVRSSDWQKPCSLNVLCL
jgi:hypothetical protein